MAISEDEAEGGIVQVERIMSLNLMWGTSLRLKKKEGPGRP
jgi:hypothetical protein